jgi:hypothetical protein
LADGGVGAIVLFSLFEEQLREEALRNAELLDGPAESFAEALDYLPAIGRGPAANRGNPQLPSGSATDQQRRPMRSHAVGGARGHVTGCSTDAATLVASETRGKALAMPGRESGPTVRSASHVDL